MDQIRIETCGYRLAISVDKNIFEIFLAYPNDEEAYDVFEFDVNVIRTINDANLEYSHVTFQSGYRTFTLDFELEDGTWDILVDDNDDFRLSLNDWDIDCNQLINEAISN